MVFVEGKDAKYTTVSVIEKETKISCLFIAFSQNINFALPFRGDAQKYPFCQKSIATGSFSVMQKRYQATKASRAGRGGIKTARACSKKHVYGTSE